MQRNVGSTVSSANNYARLTRPAKRTPLQKFGDFFYDKRNGTCFTRTCVNWFAISIYYAAFLFGVFLVFYISMLIAQAVASRRGDRPEFVLGDSFIGSSPGLNFFPIKDSKNLLWLTSKNKSNSKYVDIISDVFDSYTEDGNEFDPSLFKECSLPPFGYDKYSPCIYIRMNRVIEWKPKPYRADDRLPNDMPENVKKQIKNSKKPKIWLSCHGTKAKDRDHVTNDSFKFQGEPGFDPSPFPYKKGGNFLDPIVALKFSTNTRKILISFTCEAWAKHLDRSKSKVEVLCYFE